MTFTPLATAADLAERLSITETLAKRLSKRDKWPHVQFSGKTIRYREEHVEAIIARYEKTGELVDTATAQKFGQTAGSRRRSA